MSLDPDLVSALDKMMRNDLDAWSTFWFWILVVSTIFVVIGIVGEAPEVWQAVGLGRKTTARIREFWYTRIKRVDFNGWERLCPELISSNERHRKWVAAIGFIGWVLVIGGVAGEGFAEYFVNDAENETRDFEHAVLVETQRSANSASAASALAFDFANKSETASLNALSLATGARKEADSFETDIQSAKTQAAEADSHLAEATKRAKELTSQLDRLTTPRQLFHKTKLADSLKVFSGTEYM